MRGPYERRRYGPGGTLDFAVDAVQHIHVFIGVLGVDTVAAVARAPREVRAGGMHAGQCAIRNPVAVDVEVAREALRLLEPLLAVLGDVDVRDDTRRPT